MTDFMRQYEIFLHKAKADLRLVQKNIHDAEIDVEILYFHLQQATEKLLKCLLSFKQVHFGKIHDLQRLMKNCQENRILLPESVKQLVELHDFAVRFRYDILDDIISSPEHFLDLTEKLLCFVEQQISKHRDG